MIIIKEQWFLPYFLNQEFPTMFLQQNSKKKQNNKSSFDFLDPEEFHFRNREIIKIHNCFSTLDPQSLKTSKSQLPLCTNLKGSHREKKSFKLFFFFFLSSTHQLIKMSFYTQSGNSIKKLPVIKFSVTQAHLWVQKDSKIMTIIEYIFMIIIMSYLVYNCRNTKKLNILNQALEVLQSSFHYFEI